MTRSSDKVIIGVKFKLIILGVTVSLSSPTYALLSVSDKTGLFELAECLVENQINILSTGGTASFLTKQGIPVIEVSDYTGFPEIMNGRIKTLHPRIHGGILRRPDEDDQVMDAHGIKAIDIVVVNLYPFVATINHIQNQKSDNFEALAIENIDIGGPTMIRAAAKNYQQVAVVTDPDEYSALIDELKTSKTIALATRKRLANKAFAHTAQYDTAIANFFSERLNADTESEDLFPSIFQPTYQRQEILRYGENPHQQAAFYIEANRATGNISHAKQWQGKALSYNNIADADAALECVKQFTEPACVIVKHANPSGIAVHQNQLDAYQNAYHCDPTSAFGGIIAFNTELEKATAQQILANQFVEVIIAPQVNSEALTLLEAKPNIRVLACGSWSDTQPALALQSVSGGLLLQQRDLGKVDLKQLKIVSQQIPTENEMNDLIFAWKVAKFVKSNAIVYARNNSTLGIGAGQMSRIDSAKIAVSKAHERDLSLENSVMASDAFFPFADCIEYAAKYGIKAIIQPGGSINDEKIIAAVDQLNLMMVFTGMRHFKH